MRKILLPVLCLGLSLSLASCGKSIVATLTFDPEGGQLVYYPEGATDPEKVDSDNPIFDLAGKYSYTADANSELPQIIRTLQSVKEGYHFSGWGFVRDGTTVPPYIEDFSDVRMPYSSVTYRAVFTPLSTLEFIPVDSARNPLVLEGREIQPITLKGDDYYVGAAVDNTQLNRIVQQLEDEVSGEGEDVGYFSGIYADKSTDSSALGSITIDSESMVFYCVFSEYPIFTIHYGGAQDDVSVHLEPGADLTPYLPKEDPTLAGAIFDGWYADSQYTVPFYPQNTGYIMSASNMDIYAHFFRSIPITYHLPAGWTLGSGSPTSIYTGRVATDLVDPVAPQGFEFQGWFSDSDVDGGYDSDEVLLDGNTKVPDGLQAATLSPLYTEWDKVYLDLRGLELKSWPSAFTPVADAAGIYSLPALLGADLLAYQNLDQYVTASESERITGFQFFALTEKDGNTLLQNIEDSEVDPFVSGLKTMPDHSVIMKPVVETLKEVVLHLPSGDRKVLAGDQDMVSNPTSSLFNLTAGEISIASTESDYLSQNLVGWSTEAGGTRLSYPFLLASVSDLYPVYAKHTSLTLLAADGTSTSSVYEGNEGDGLTATEVESLQATIDAAYPAVDGVTPVVAYVVTDAKGVTTFYANLQMVKFNSTNSTLTVKTRK